MTIASSFFTHGAYSYDKLHGLGLRVYLSGVSGPLEEIAPRSSSCMPLKSFNCLAEWSQIQPHAIKRLQRAYVGEGPEPDLSF